MFKYYIFLFGLCSIIVAYNLPDHDIWWHIQIGRDIAVNHIWPSPDRYSFLPPQEWVVHSWLVDCVFYCIHRMGKPLWNWNEYFPVECFRIFILSFYGVCIFRWVSRFAGINTISYICALLACFLIWEYPARPLIFNPIWFFAVWSG